MPTILEMARVNKIHFGFSSASVPSGSKTDDMLGTLLCLSIKVKLIVIIVIIIVVSIIAVLVNQGQVDRHCLHSFGI